MKKVNEVSRLAGVSKRTLQFYDDEGLLPAQRSKDNYRLYDDAALERLWEILVYRAMGLDLKEIKDLLTLSEKQKKSVSGKENPRAQATDQTAERADGIYFICAAKWNVTGSDRGKHCGKDLYGSYSSAEKNEAGSKKGGQREMKKRLIMVMVAMGMACSLMACGLSGNTQDSEKTLTSKKDNFGITLGKFSKKATIEEKVLYDKDNVKITATNLEYGEEAANLKLKIENNSKKKLTFSAGTMGYGVNAINGFMVSGGYLNCEADAGESIDEEMSFDYEELILLGMKEIADIRVGFTISDEDFNNIYTKPVQIKTSFADSYDYSKNSKNYHKAITSKALKYTYDIDIPYFETDEIYSSNGIKVVSEGYMKNADGDRVLFLEVQNNSENMIYFQTSDLKVNEKKLYDGTWSYDCILAGCTTLVNIDVDYGIESYAENTKDFEQVETIGFTAQAENKDEYVVSEPSEITVTVPVIEKKLENDTEQEEGENTEDQKADAVVSTDEQSEGEVSADFKKMMDSYEDFFDEYIEFMRKYENSDDVAGMLNDYADYMTKYADYMQKLNDVDTDNLSTADAAYYTKVQARIVKKLAEIQ